MAITIVWPASFDIDEFYRETTNQAVLAAPPETDAVGVSARRNFALCKVLVASRAPDHEDVTIPVELHVDAAIRVGRYLSGYYSGHNSEWRPLANYWNYSGASGLYVGYQIIEVTT